MRLCRGGAVTEELLTAMAASPGHMGCIGVLRGDGQLNVGDTAGLASRGCTEALRFLVEVLVRSAPGSHAHVSVEFYKQ